MLRFDRLWAFIALAGVVAIMNLAPIMPNDYWFHLQYGYKILETGLLPWTDTFTFTMFGTPYPALGVYWLGEVFMALIHRYVPGWQTTVYGLVILSAYWIIYKASMRRAGNHYAAGIALIIGVALGLTNWNIRPQIFAYLYFAIIIYCVQLYRDELPTKTKIALISVALTSILLWQNTHGTFLFGYLIIGASIVRSYSGRKLWFAIIILSLLPFISPLGLSMPAYFLRMLGENMAARNIIEWQPALITEITGQIFYPLLVLVILLSFKKPKLHWTEWAIFGFLLLLSLRYRRAILFWGMYIIPLLAVELSKFSFSRKEMKTNDFSTKFNFLLFTVVSFLVLLTFPPIKTFLPIPEDRKNSFSANTPSQAVSFLIQELPKGNVFAHFSYSAYITFETQAEFKTFMDTRFDLYNDDVFGDYLIINGAQDGWRSIAAKYPIDHWLVSKTEQIALEAELRVDDLVKLVYEDDEYSLFTTEDQ